MKVRFLAVLIIGVLVLALGAACSDDDDGDENGDNGDNGGVELTLAEYFSKLETLSQGYASDLDALDADADAEVERTESDEEAVEVFVNFVGNMRAATDNFVGRMDALNGPTEVEGAQGEAVTAGQAVVDMFDNALTVLDTVDTFVDATLVLEGPGFTDAQDEFGVACVALQGIADDNGLEIDMNCPG